MDQISFDPRFLTLLTVWSNFEIGDLDLWRSEAYNKFVDFLDEKGGFYYEVRVNVSFSFGFRPDFFLAMG